MSEHQQQHKGKYLASCWDCVNEMRLECIQLLAHVAGGEWGKVGCGVQHNVEGDLLPRDTDTLNARVTAAAAYLEHTSFTDEGAALAAEEAAMAAAKAARAVEADGDGARVLKLGERLDVPLDADIHEWLAERYPRISEAIEIYGKWSIVVMLRNAAGDLPLQMLNASLDETWKGGNR